MCNNQTDTKSQRIQKYTKSDATVIGIVFDILQKFIIITIIYLIGYIGWSVAWIYCLTIVFTIANRLSDDKKQQWKISRVLAMGLEKELILTNFKYLPSWVHFPDVERVEWLNRIIRKTWTRVDNYTRDLVPNLVEPVVQSYIKSFKFDEVILGHVPLRIDGVKVYDEDTERNKIVMDMDISYAGDCHITFQIAGMTGGIEDFQLRGRLRVVMKPLISTIPIIGGLKVFFMEEPEIDFDLVGMAQVLAVPGLRNILQKSVLETINSMFLFPNTYPIKLSNNVETEELKVFEPEGILRVHCIEAKHLMKKDFGIMGNGKSDPYTILTVGPKKFKTPTIDNTVDPKWDFWCEFAADINSELRLHVWDQDEGSKDETLGSAVVSVEKIAQKGHDDLWIPLEDVMHGMIHIRVTWLSLSPEISDLDTILKETQLLGPTLHSALFFIYIDSAKKIKRAKHSSDPDPYVVVQIEKDSKQTNIVQHTCNPIWEKGFIFMLLNPKTATIQLNVIDKKTDHDIGYFYYRISDIFDWPNLQIKRQPFVLVRSGPESTIICSLKLRIFKKVESDEFFDTTSEDSSEKINEVQPLKKQNSSLSQRSNKSNVSRRSCDRKSHNSDDGRSSNLPSTPRNSLSSIEQSTYDSKCSSIKLTLKYCDQRQRLIVNVHEIINLPKKHESLPDSYVKLYILPGKHKNSKRKTQIIKDNCDPIFDETFEYLISLYDLNKTKLEIIVATAKKLFGIGNNFLGQVTIDLAEYDLTKTYSGWFELGPRQRYKQ